MSEEILKALMELFALIVKQDSGIMTNEREYVSLFLKKQLTREAVSKYLALFDSLSERDVDEKDTPGDAAPSVRDSVKILGICKKINRTLNQEQKVVVIVRLYELVNSDRQFTTQRTNILSTVAEVFRIKQSEVFSLEQFIKNDQPGDLANENIRVLHPGDRECDLCKKLHTGYQDTIISFLRVPSVDLYFLKYSSPDQLFLNGLPVFPGQVYTFAKGGSVKSLQGHPVYYSDVSSTFLSEENEHHIQLTVENVSFIFSDSFSALKNISFSVEEGNLIGILGASGSGKTTLLNLMSGIQKPTSGSIRINGTEILKNTKAIEGVIGYVPQDDLLIEDLTVFENLFYAARLCFGNKTIEEIKDITLKTLLNLGLYDKRDLKVGSPLNKVISGGQRKRLNIALELIREPSVLFLDEPTSGLSSGDSENLMDLLRDMTLKGRLIVTVIHQPSSEIFKMFDKVVILDKGGYMAYFGNPVESVIYFKTMDAQINSSIGECPSCGNVNPEIIFKIIETKVVDEFGRYTEKRKVRPSEWADNFARNYPFIASSEKLEPPPRVLNRPSRFTQLKIYLVRDLKSKIVNRQYLLLTILEAPVLGFILSFLIRYIPDPSSDHYVFFENENIPIYIFMSIIVALFLGLTLSAQEIFRDRKIIKREHFLHLSRNSYLLSKVSILIMISVVQVLLFLIIANPVLGLKGLFLRYFIALFTTAFCANMIGLNISASFNSAITIYIVIPLIIIPMMVLSGAMFPFDKLNRSIGNVDKVPFIAELIPTRWTYEALMVSQFRNNRYNRFKDSSNGKTIYDYKKSLSTANYYTVKLVPALIAKLEKADSLYLDRVRRERLGGETPVEVSAKNMNSNLILLKNELNKLVEKYPTLKPFRQLDDLNADSFNETVYENLMNYLRFVSNSFNQTGNRIEDEWDEFYLTNKKEIQYLENRYSNLKLQEIVTKFYERDKNKVLEYRNSLIRNYDPVYVDPVPAGFGGFRTHFFAPVKQFFGRMTDTFIANISLVLISNVFLYIILYFNLLGRLVGFAENLRIRK